MKRTTIELAACCSWFKQAAPVAADCLAEQRRRVATLCVALESPAPLASRAKPKLHLFPDYARVAASVSPCSAVDPRRGFGDSVARMRMPRGGVGKAEIQPATHTSRVPMSAVFSEDLPAGRPEVARESTHETKKKVARPTRARADCNLRKHKRKRERRAAAEVGASTSTSVSVVIPN